MADHPSQSQLQTPSEQPISVQDAGRKGGRKTADTYGSKHYQTIGKKGGDRTSELVRLGREAEAQTAL